MEEDVDMDPPVLTMELVEVQVTSMASIVIILMSSGTESSQKTSMRVSLLTTEYAQINNLHTRGRYMVKTLLG